MYKIVIILGICIVILAGCGSFGGRNDGNNEDSNDQEEQKIDLSSIDYSVDVVKDFTDAYAQGEELLCLTDSEDSAKEIAELYGIELVSFQNGIATFHTEEDPIVVIQRGQENGYPEISLNGISYIQE